MIRAGGNLITTFFPLIRTSPSCILLKSIPPLTTPCASNNTLLSPSPAIHFTDVPATDTFCKHVHYLWARGIIGGCGPTTYCPNDPVTRDAMAKFLSNAFNTPLYGP